MSGALYNISRTFKKSKKFQKIQGGQFIETSEFFFLIPYLPTKCFRWSTQTDAKHIVNYRHHFLFLQKKVGVPQNSDPVWPIDKPVWQKKTLEEAAWQKLAGW